jgi:hypothetical protein
LGNPSELNDWQHDIKDDITLLVAKTVTHPHFVEACREFPEVEEALARAKRFLESADGSSRNSVEAIRVLDEVAIALGRVQSKFGW